MRKLVTIREVSDLIPIEDADLIECAVVDGWQVVVRKGEFQKHDLGVYFEIDSFLSIEPRYEFLRNSSFKKNNLGEAGFRLKTIKLRGQISQGLLLPLSIFPELDCKKLGDEVTEQLGVIKYEPPIPANLRGMVRGLVPAYLFKTDEERIQNLMEWFTLYRDIEFEATEKLDGSSMMIFYNDEQTGLCSRNLELVETPENTLWKVTRTLHLIEALEKIGRNVALQTECVGENIQKNPLRLVGQTAYLFNVYDIDRAQYLLPVERYKFVDELAAAGAIVKHVPVVHERLKLFELYSTVESVLNYSKGRSIINSKHDREGLVFKSHTYIQSDIISCKAINNEYLLHEDEE